MSTLKNGRSSSALLERRDSFRANAKRLIPFALGIISWSSAPAARYDWSLSGVHVVAVEASYMPDHVTFLIDGNAGLCPAGSWLIWPGQGPDAASKQANVRAVYSLLMAAKLSSDTIDLFGNNGKVDDFCAAAVFIHLH
jgi:hypothetical protein